MAIDRHHAFVAVIFVLEFQSDHAQWRSKRGNAGMRPVRRPWRRINTLYADI